MSGDYGMVAERLARLRDAISESETKAGRAPGSVHLMAVSKFHPVAALEAAYAAGQRLFGESRVQEAEEKAKAFFGLRPDAEMWMIGHVQSNKAERAASLFRGIQSVDSGRLIARLERALRGAGPKLPVFLELHTAEDSKEGFEPGDGLWRALDAVAASERLEIAGFMTMAAFSDDEKIVRPSFVALREAREEALRRHPELGGRLLLSMGMSNDYRLAIEEGADIVRVGSAIFGSREA